MRSYSAPRDLPVPQAGDFSPSVAARLAEAEGQLRGVNVALNGDGTIAEADACKLEAELYRRTGQAFQVDRRHDMRADGQVRITPQRPQ